MSVVRSGAAPKVAESGAPAVDEFHILMVCTGNICRSPMAEQMLTAYLDRGLTDVFGAEHASVLAAQLVVSSAGTYARKGTPMTPESMAESERYGAGGGSHAAHRLSAQDVQSADLVLAMTQQHRGIVAQLAPRAAQRAFTLTEFARLVSAPGVLETVEESDPDDLAGALAALVPAVAVWRGSLPPAKPSELDIVDPYGRGARVYAQVASIISEATSTLADAFVTLLRDA